MDSNTFEPIADAIRSEVQKALDSTKFTGRTFRSVLEKRFALNGEPRGYSQSLDQIAKDMRITRERVRQIEAKALRQVREQTDHDWSQYAWWSDVSSELNFMRAIEGLNND